MLFLMQMTKLKNGTKTYHSKVPLWILVLFLMQMMKLKNGTKTYHSKVPLRFIKITVDYTEHLILKNRRWYNKK